MTTLTSDVPNILDVSSRYTSDGKPLPIAEILTTRKPVLLDIPWYECNTTNGHRIGVEVQLPVAVARKLNGGVAPSTGKVDNVTEATAEFASLGVVDKVLADLSANPTDFRIKKNSRHIEAIGQKFESEFFNGSSVTPESFVGLRERYASLSGTLAYQMLTGSGSGSDLSSMWLVGWGMNSIYGIYAKGTKAGISHVDYGDELVSDGAGGQYPAYRDWFNLQCGIAIEDPRDIVRVCNVQTSALTASGQTGAKLIDLFVQGSERLEHPDSVKPVWYVPRKIHEYLRLQIANKSNVHLGLDEWAGKKMLHIDGIPIRRTDAIGYTETTIS